VEVALDRDGRVTVPGTEHFGGSALTLDAEAVARTVKFSGVSIREAMTMASTRAAAVVGFDDAGPNRGGLEPRGIRIHGPLDGPGGAA
jgi:N-acetylglucosamine-6-phosphate deacetylase